MMRTSEVDRVHNAADLHPEVPRCPVHPISSKIPNEIANLLIIFVLHLFSESGNVRLNRWDILDCNRDPPNPIGLLLVYRLHFIEVGDIHRQHSPASGAGAKMVCLFIAHSC
jgi:hypothetical protein